MKLTSYCCIQSSYFGLGLIFRRIGASFPWVKGGLKFEKDFAYYRERGQSASLAQPTPVMFFSAVNSSGMRGSLVSLKPAKFQVMPQSWILRLYNEMHLALRELNRLVLVVVTCDQDQGEVKSMSDVEKVRTRGRSLYRSSFLIGCIL